MKNDWMLMLHSYANGIYDYQGSGRGVSRISPNGRADHPDSLTVTHRFTVDLMHTAASNMHFGASANRQFPLRLIKFSP